MKTSIALLAALVLVPCACTRPPQPSPVSTVVAEPIDPRPAIQPEAQPAPAVARPDPPPTAEEIAAFHAEVPK